MLLHFARLLSVTSVEQRRELLVFYFNLCTVLGLAEVWQLGEGFLRPRGSVCLRAMSHMGAGRGLILHTHGSLWLSPVHVAWPGEGRGGRLVAVGVPVPAARYGSLAHLTTHGEVGCGTA